MWEVWFYKTILAFISIKVLNIVFQENIRNVIKRYDNDNKRNVNRIKININALLLSMIPFLRWVFVGLIVIVVFAAAIDDDN